MGVYLVCEGPPNSLDNRVLDRLVVQFHSLPVQVAPSGGSGGHGAVRVHLEQASRGNVAVTIEDRDYFHTFAEADILWMKPNPRKLRWRRHEIENYLLEPDVLLALFIQFRSSQLAWAANLPKTEAEALLLLQSVAAPLLENHVGEVLRVELLHQSRAAGNLQYGPAAPATPQGRIKPGQVEWIPALQQEASRLLQCCGTVRSSSAFDPAAIAARFQAILAELQNQGFLRSTAFLTEMAGKDLMRSLAAYLQGVGAPSGYSSSSLESDLLDALASVYQPSSTFQPDDFAELADVLRRC